MALAAVQIRSRSMSALALTRDERKNAEAAASPLPVKWSAPVVRDRSDTETGYSLDALILVFILGSTFASLIKPFLQGVATKAGEDTWEGIKRLISRVWSLQSEKAYRLSAHAFVITELGDEFVAIRFSLPEDTRIEAEAGAAIDRQLADLIRHLPSIYDNIQKFQLGDGVTSRIHIIRAHGERWIIHASDSKEFFGD